MTEREAADIRAELKTLNARFAALQQFVLPVLAAVIGDRALGGSLEQMLANIEDTRLRVHRAIKASDGDPHVDLAVSEGVDALFSSLAKFTAAVAFDIESEDL